MSRFVTQTDFRERPGRISSAPVLTEPGAIGTGSEEIAITEGGRQILSALTSITAKNMREDAQRLEAHEFNNAVSSLISGTDEIMLREDLTPSQKAESLRDLNQGIMSGFTSRDAANRFNARAASHISQQNRRLNAERIRIGVVEARRFIDALEADASIEGVDSFVDSIGLPKSISSELKDDARLKIDQSQRSIAANDLASNIGRDSKLGIIQKVRDEHSFGMSSTAAANAVLDEAASAVAQTGDPDETKFLLDQMKGVNPARKQSLLNTAMAMQRSQSDFDKAMELIGTGNPKGEPFPGSNRTLNKVANSILDKRDDPAVAIRLMLDAGARRIAPVLSNRVKKDLDDGRAGDFVRSMNEIERSLGKDEADRIARDMGMRAITTRRITGNQGFRDLDALSKIEAINLLSGDNAQVVMDRAESFLSGDKETDPIEKDRFVGRLSISDAEGIIFRLRRSQGLSPDQWEDLYAAYRFAALTHVNASGIGASELTESDANSLIDIAVGTFNTMHKKINIGSVDRYLPTDVVSDDSEIQIIENGINNELADYVRELKGGPFASFQNLESFARVATERPIQLKGKTYIAAVDESGVIGFVRYDPDAKRTDLVTPQQNNRDFEAASVAFSTNVNPRIFDPINRFSRAPLQPQNMQSALGSATVDEFIEHVQQRYEEINGEFYDADSTSEGQDQRTRDFNEILINELQRTGFDALYPDIVPAESPNE